MASHPDGWSGGESGSEAAVDLHLAGDDELEASILMLKRQIDAKQAELALRVAEYDRRRLSVDRYLLTTKQWLRSACRMTAAVAASTLRLGRSLGEMHSLANATLSGAIPIEGTRAIAAIRERHREAYDVHGAVLTEVATYLDARDLRRTIDHWEQQVLPEFASFQARSRVARRRLSVNQTFAGMWSIVGELDPESGHIVSTMIRALTDPGNLDGADSRTPTQRRADALTEACRFWLDHNDSVVTSGGVKPHITVTIDYDHLVPTGTTSPVDVDPVSGWAALPEIDGLPVAADAVRRLACDADIVRMVTRGTSEILDVGRATRTIPGAIRRALDHRDGGCTWDGCDAPTSWCDAHHIEHWADGGVTALANLRLLCRRHHGAIHDRETRPP